jgi:NTP pyrophosphatase (non-canonical NTP hydrolase)
MALTREVRRLIDAMHYHRDSGRCLNCYAIKTHEPMCLVGELEQALAQQDKDGLAQFLTEPTGLTIRALQEINLQRVARWHGLDDWSPLEWAGAMCGEAGEAANYAKKLKRIESQIPNINLEAGHSVTEADDAADNIVAEVADTVIYGVLLAARVRRDLEKAVKRKFNQKSEEYGFPERIP